MIPLAPAALALAGLLAATSPLRAQPDATVAPGEQIARLRLPGGAGQRVLVVAPAHPKAAIVMLPGGSGDVGIARDGDLRHDHNFVVRTRDLWVARGFAVLIPDTVERTNLRGLRSSPQYGALVGDLIGYARSRLSPRVFLLGTSQGSIAAMNGAAHAPAGALAGLVLTESVSMPGGSHETVFDADPSGVRVPALVVANQEDRCTVAPPAMAQRIAAAMTASPQVKVARIDGGETRSSDPCGSLSPHGYFGIEAQVVNLISRWMDDRL